MKQFEVGRFVTDDRWRRYDSRGERDFAYVVARRDGLVLYNVEAQNGDRFKHRVVSEAVFEQRWHRFS